MLVIHPQDRSTEFLRALYEKMEGVTLLCGGESRKQLASILYHRPPGELFMLLGHGGAEGLFRKEEEEYRCYVGRSMAFCLRRHPVVGVWCHANLFAESVRLHGLFSGMIVSDMAEAREYGLITTEEELERENERLAQNLRDALDKGESFEKICNAIRSAERHESALTAFNYNSFYCR